ncbi:MAG: hypothetical protein ACRC4M_02805 [Mycoplasma sp.]
MKQANTMKSYEIKVQNQSMHYYALENKGAKNLIIYLNGVNGQVDTITFFKHNVFSENNLITFDTIAHGENNHPHTKKFKDYIAFSIAMIESIKSNPKYKGMKVIIMGESFGASQTIALSELYPNIADLFFCWNAPTKSSLSSGLKFKEVIKFLASTIFNIETYSMMGIDETFTSNQEILKIRKERGLMVKTSNKLLIAALSTIKPNKKIFNKDKIPSKLVYIQSQEDFMCDFNIDFKKHKNVHLFKTGKHVLSFEPEAKQMFDILNKKIKGLK